MDTIDLNLLPALDALLAEGSVTGAARRLRLSPSAMSRTLSRLRAATGDPLLVRAGRALVPTPYAAALRQRVHDLTRDAQTILRPRLPGLDVSALERTFTIRANEAFVAFFCVAIMNAVNAAAPRASLRFLPKPSRDSALLREGTIDLEVGVAEQLAPELRTHFLFRDRMVGVVRAGHPFVSGAAPTAERFAACSHVAPSPGGDLAGPVDHALDRLGLKREVRVTVPGFLDAMRVASRSDLVAVVPRSCLGNAIAGDHAADMGLQTFDLPVAIPDFVIRSIWHPRMDGDPGHRWLRGVVSSVWRSAYPQVREDASTA